MHRPRSRRFARVTVFVVGAVLLGACHSGGPKTIDTSGHGPVDVKAACGALADLHRAGDTLSGVDVADPGTSLTALTRAVNAYGAALLTFERVAPTDLRPRAAVVRAAVLARHFGQAAVARAEIDTWASAHCSS
jgi:hypothetical protein